MRESMAFESQRSESFNEERQPKKRGILSRLFHWGSTAEKKPKSSNKIASVESDGSPKRARTTR